MPGAAPPKSPSERAIVEVEMGPYLLAAATGFGPRLVGLRFRQGPELFAQLGDEIVIEHPDSGTYRLHGGHRLWAAPEVPAISYRPDDHECEVTTGPNCLTIKAPADRAGMIKHLSVALEAKRLVIDHHLGNDGPRPIAVAPWAITLFRLGGIALLPTSTAAAEDRFQADSSLVTWPYTDMADPRLSWQSRAAVVEAVSGPRFKIGSGPSPGRIGYLIDRQLFTKEIAPAGAGPYPDRGAVGQVFVDDSSCELESVGPIVSLEPGASVSHSEVWEVRDCADLASAYRFVIGEAPG